MFLSVKIDKILKHFIEKILYFQNFIKEIFLYI